MNFTITLITVSTDRAAAQACGGLPGEPVLPKGADVRFRENAFQLGITAAVLNPPVPAFSGPYKGAPVGVLSVQLLDELRAVLFVDVAFLS